MKISVVIPAYNSAAYLAEAIASVRAQTRAVDEIIVVDDGSADDTAAVAETLGVRLLRQPNTGPSAARNLALREARGEWIAFLDADDQWTPDKLVRQCAALARAPALMLIASDMAEVDAQGLTVIASMQAQHGLRTRFERLAGLPIPHALRMLLEKNFIPTGTVLVRRDALLAVGGFNTAIRYGEDLELWCRIAARHPIACLPEVHMLRRRHGANATDRTGAMLNDLISVMRALAADCPEMLCAEGLRPEALIAHALNDLGYWHFDHGRQRDARAAFRMSLAESPAARALFYYAASCLPRTAVTRLRQLKQRLKPA
jgi:glycosyltransferase involved in cell wall biosynthesis